MAVARHTTKHNPAATVYLPAGTTLGPYEIVSPIEAGGMGSVFRAMDTRLHREVAVKVLPAEAMEDYNLVKRFEREARAAAAVTHPNIVAIFDVGEAQVLQATPLGADKVTVSYLVEELVEGSSLRKLIRAGRTPHPRLIAVAEGIARGLHAAHAKGLIHRDLKPENILLDRAGQPKIVDFGLVRWIYPGTSVPSTDGDLTRTGFVVGTLGYMSPEQARGDPVTPASDIFVFGTLLYELLTGSSPFARPNADEAFKAVLKTDPPPLLEKAPQTPPELAAIVERCLEKDLEKRYSSAAQILRDLERLRRDLKLEEPVPRIGSSGSNRKPREPRVVRETPPLLVLASALAVVTAFGGGYLARGRTVSAPPAAPARPELWNAEWRAERCAAGAEESAPSEAALSPDGRTVVLTVPTGDESDLYAMPSRGPASPRRLTADEVGGRAPVFSPDGLSVLFSASRLAQSEGVWEVPLDGSAPARRLVEDGEEPAVSPDGKALTWVRRTVAGTDLMVARRDGTLPQRVIGGQGADWRFPIFTTNGSAVLLHDVHRGGTFAGSSRLLLVPLSQPRLLVFEETRRLDPAQRVVPLWSGNVLIRSFADRSALVLEPRGRGAHRLPFGAALVAISPAREARAVLTRSEGGPLILWRRS